MMECVSCHKKQVKGLFLLENGPKSSQKVLDAPSAEGKKRIDVKILKCMACGTVQTDPSWLGSQNEYWKDYLNSRACTELYVQYDQELAEKLLKSYSLKGKHVVELGCGDGYFAAELIKRGVKVSAFEPSAAACEVAEKVGVNCYNQLLDENAHQIIDEPFDGFVTKQVLDLVPDPDHFLKCLQKILKVGAVGLIDVPSWSKTLLDKRYFSLLPDRISYFTARTLTELLERNHFHVLEVFHGAGDEYVGAYVHYEGEANGLEESFLEGFDLFKDSFSKIIHDFQQHSKKVIGWGAGAKGATIFSIMGMTPDSIRYVIDKDRTRWGKYLPGSLIEVVKPEHFKTDPPDVVVITAAMFYKEIVKELFNVFQFRGDIVLLSPLPRVLKEEEIAEILNS